MRYALAALLFAAPCAFAATALAQTAQGYDYGPAGPVGAAVTAPFNVAGGALSAPFGGGATGGGLTIASQTGARTYSYDTIPPSPALIGHCDIISGNRVCFAN
jgi:hypothetical protein